MAYEDPRSPHMWSPEDIRAENALDEMMRSSSGALQDKNGRVIAADPRIQVEQARATLRVARALERLAWVAENGQGVSSL